jgi:hypothetical protein
MQRWDLTQAIDEPNVLLSTPDARCIILDVDATNSLGEHRVHERTILLVIDGDASVSAGDSVEQCPRGTLLHLEPGESRSIHASDRARLLLVLAPWPAADHYPPDEVAAPHELPASATLPPS